MQGIWQKVGRYTKPSQAIGCAEQKQCDEFTCRHTDCIKYLLFASNDPTVHWQIIWSHIYFLLSTSPMFVIVSCQLLCLCSSEQYLWRWIVTISVYICICLVSGSSGWALAAYAATRAVHAALACNFHLWETPLNGNQTDIIVKSIKYSGGCCKYFLALLKTECIKRFEIQPCIVLRF